MDRTGSRDEHPTSREAGGSRLCARELLCRLRTKLEPVFGGRLKGLVLYGSEARGDASEQSDIDVLVLLKEPVRLGDDLWTIIQALYPLQLELDRLLEVLPASVDGYEAGECALYRNAKREGLRS